VRAPQEVADILVEGSRRQARLNELRERVDRLTQREREVLQAVVEGFSAEEAAQRLFISSNTHRTHIGNILTKLGARTQLQAVLVAHALGAVSIRDPLPAHNERTPLAR
jgi:DNA-binding CsgD family transcriptional regulator